MFPFPAAANPASANVCSEAYVTKRLYACRAASEQKGICDGGTAAPRASSRRAAGAERRSAGAIESSVKSVSALSLSFPFDFFEEEAAAADGDAGDPAPAPPTASPPKGDIGVCGSLSSTKGPKCELPANDVPRITDAAAAAAPAPVAAVESSTNAAQSGATTATCKPSVAKAPAPPPRNEPPPPPPGTLLLGK